jgi:hypothetical protein
VVRGGRGGRVIAGAAAGAPAETGS